MPFERNPGGQRDPPQVPGAGLSPLELSQRLTALRCTPTPRELGLRKAGMPPAERMRGAHAIVAWGDGSRAG